MAEDPQGVPISAIVFGGRRASLVPLVFEARDWTHGVLVGASMGSETTAAATGAVGVMRRDPMAMKPFCGYNFADYFAHWLSFDKEGAQLPKVFHVNWFRKGDDGKFLWPGFGDNLRVLEWMLKRVEGTAGSVETPIGHLPADGELNLDGLELGPEAREKLFGFDRAAWAAEFAGIGHYLDEYGPRMPAALKAQQAEIAAAAVGLESLRQPCQVSVFTDSRYVVETMNGRFRRKTNLPWWERLDRAAGPHKVHWEWTRGHDGHLVQEAADKAARKIAAAVKMAGRDMAERSCGVTKPRQFGGEGVEVVVAGDLDPGDVVAVEVHEGFRVMRAALR
mgnify:CR=1 FL=1